MTIENSNENEGLNLDKTYIYRINRLPFKSVNSAFEQYPDEFGMNSEKTGNKEGLIQIYFEPFEKEWHLLIKPFNQSTPKGINIKGKNLEDVLAQFNMQYNVSLPEFPSDVPLNTGKPGNWNKIIKR